MKIKHVFKKENPFDELYYPSGATGLTVNITGYHFAKDAAGYHYVLREVVQSREYIDNQGEYRIGVTCDFIDTFWKVKTASEARILLMYLKTGKAHYKKEFKII